jgi:hypothetical protein
MHASAGWYGDHTVDATRDGVTVRKGLDLDTLALPAVKFEIVSERDHPVGVRVVDSLPTAVDAARIGLHADFAADQWTAFADGRIAFTTRLDPGRPVVTLYGVWLDDPGTVHDLLDRPDVAVTSDPDAPSLSPTGDPVDLQTVDDSLRSVGPAALEDLRDDVEEALTAVRATPSADDGAGDDGAEGHASGSDGDEGTMGDHAWTYPVERVGLGRIAAPSHADLDALVDEAVGEGHVYVRAAMTETHHGGGGALLLQELANAFEIVARRVTGDSERATVDAVVRSELGADAVLQALGERDQVSDALVSPLVGDRDDATGIDATPTSSTAAAARPGTQEVSVEPDTEDVEVVLNADGERFAELQAEFDRETDVDALESELQDLDLPGVETTAEPTIEELVEDADAVDDDGADEFVPASVDASDSDFEFGATDQDEVGEDGEDQDGDATELDFATDATAEPERSAAVESGATETAAEKTASDEFSLEPTSSSESALPAGTDQWPGEPSSEAEITEGSVVADDTQAGAGDDTGLDADGASDDGPGTPSSEDDDTAYVKVPAPELEAMRDELRELRDRVATLEAEFDTVRDDRDRSSAEGFEYRERESPPVERADGGVRPSDVDLSFFEAAEESGDE